MKPTAPAVAWGTFILPRLRGRGTAEGGGGGGGGLVGWNPLTIP